MNTIRRIGILVILTVFLSARAGAEAGQRISVSPQAGILHGQAEEIVYKYSNSDLYLSELLWDLKPLFYAGIAADFGPGDPFRRQGFTASISIKCGLPYLTGIMEDRDWLNDSFDYPTHYSRHDAYSNFAILSDVSAGYSWHLTDFFSLKAYGEFSYMHFSWFALDGYVQYPPDDPYENYQKWDDSIPKRYVSGRVMSYTLDWFVLSPGISLTAKLNRLFSLEGDFKYTPLIYCSDRDEHLKTGVTYFDYSSFGHYFRGKGSVIFSLTKNMDLSLALSYSYITGTRGDVNVEGYVFRNGAGAGYSALDLGLAAKIRLYGRD